MTDTIENNNNTNAEYSKPKYKNLINFLHSRNHYLDVDAFTAENRVELLSNFIMTDKKCHTGGKCFCSKLLKNVFWVDCILTNEPMMVGGGCKSLFTTRNKKKKRQQFLDRTLHLFRNNLGFEKIIDWNDFIGQSLDNYLRNSSYGELQRLQELYKDNENILDRIARYIGGENYTPTYQNFIDDIENDIDMDLYIRDDEYNEYWKKYLLENYHDRINILTIWFSKNMDVYNYIHEILADIEKTIGIVDNEKNNYERVVFHFNNFLYNDEEKEFYFKEKSPYTEPYKQAIITYLSKRKKPETSGYILSNFWKKNDKEAYSFIKKLYNEMGVNYIK